MSKRDRPLIALHEDLPLFREAVAFTAAHTNFAARLIEKDYYCTLLLDYLVTLLKPVLRPADYRSFDLDRAIQIVTSMTHRLDR